ncbi:riboflavin biosynthesis protein [Bacteroidia bacterium]|nr:riboflavin biosynthesis protein [Bacteroidia bacterium]
MKIRSLNNSPDSLDETVATVGFFDGVHRGHRYLIDQMRAEADKNGLKTAVITFPVHPRKILQQDYQPKLLNSLDERLRLLDTTGVDYCYLADFTPQFANTTAQDFIQNTLREQLRVKTLLVGYDHKFGKNRVDETEQYVAYGQACGMQVIPTAPLPENENPTSSTTIRHLLENGKIREANERLSYNYPLEGEVIHGNHLGRTIGFPTANIALNEPDKMIPKEGVYAVRALVNGRTCAAMAYIGKRPTVTALGEQRIEVNIFDFDEDIYGENLKIELVEYIRDDVKFNGLEELKAQLGRDAMQSINVMHPM